MNTGQVMKTASEYIDAIVRRNRVPMDPMDFEPDWADQPRRHNVYPAIHPIPLPSKAIPLDSVNGAVTEPRAIDGRLDLATLSEMLRDSYGYTGRRLGITHNSDAWALPQYARATWSRGTASGGGLYPLEIYWSCGPSGPMMPGIYNYCAPQHGMQRLFAGDATAAVRRAIGPVEADRAGDQFLLVTVKFWKNAFKYRSFCYHAVTMDVGTVLGTWQLWSRAAGVSLRPLLTFDEQALNQLLSVRTHEESVFAVIPVPWTRPAPTLAHPGEASEVRVTARPVERSRRVVRYPIVEQVHASTVSEVLADEEMPSRLDDARPIGPNGPGTVLADAVALDHDVRTALRARRSSFGRFSAHKELKQAELSAVLRAGTLGSRLVTNIKRPDGTPELTRLTVFVNHVEGVLPGVYDYDLPRNTLVPVATGEVGSFLQRNYFLNNYNLEQAAAVITVMARPHAAIAAAGQQGYRWVNAEVGAAAQSLYTAASVAGIGCGAALGFDNVSYLEQFWVRDVDDPGSSHDEWPLLIVMLGHERRQAPDFYFKLG